MPGPLNPKQAKEVVRLRKKQTQGKLNPLEKRRLKKLTGKVDAGLRGVVKEIRKEDP